MLSWAPIQVVPLLWMDLLEVDPEVEGKNMILKSKLLWLL